MHACVITAGDPAFVAGSLREQPLAEIWRTSSSLRLLRAARARDRAECLACPVADACGGECWVQAHYAARARGEPRGLRGAVPRTATWCARCSRSWRRRRMRPRPTAEAAAPAGDDCVAAGACGGQSAAGARDYALFDCI